jgi:hypothetical protein
MHTLGSISAIASEKNIFLYFSIWSCVNTMTCGGSHLGFPIGIKKNKNLRGPSNDYSCLYKLCVFYVDRNSKMTTTAGHSFYIVPIGSFYNQMNNTGS